MLRSIFFYLKDREARLSGLGEAYVIGKDEKASPNAGPIERSFYGHQGRPAHKLHHYLPLYDRYFAPFQGRQVRFLEIGVAKGGSLQLWRNFFGSQARIYGIDINPECAKLDGEAGTVRIGSQTDPAFLKSVVSEMGGVDIVLDDGSHVARHMRASLEILFPLLSEGGLYVVEDLCAAYWPKYGGGYERGSNFFATVRSITDDMHHWYHARGIRVPALKDKVAGVHVHDSLVVIEKRSITHPSASIRPLGG
jgi:hypothetical protein